MLSSSNLCKSLKAIKCSDSRVETLQIFKIAFTELIQIIPSYSNEVILVSLSNDLLREKGAPSH